MVVAVESARRGMDDARPWWTQPSTWQAAGGRPERLVVAILTALAEYCGWSARVVCWDLERADSREEFRMLVGELSEGLDALRGVLDDTDDLSS